MAEDYKLEMTASEINSALKKVKSITSSATSIVNTVDKVKAITSSATDIVNAVKLFKTIEYGSISAKGDGKKSILNKTIKFQKTHSSTPKVMLQVRFPTTTTSPRNLTITAKTTTITTTSANLIIINSSNMEAPAETPVPDRSFYIDYLVIG